MSNESTPWVPQAVFPIADGVWTDEGEWVDTLTWDDDAEWDDQ